MNILSRILLASVLSWAPVHRCVAADPARQAFADVLSQVADLFEVKAGPSRTLMTVVEVVYARGWDAGLVGRPVSVAFQAPDRLQLAAKLGKDDVWAGRDGQEIWSCRPGKGPALIGAPGVKHNATRADAGIVRLAPVQMPWSAQQLALLPYVCQVDGLPDQVVEGVRCRVVRARPLAQAKAALQVPAFTLTLWLRDGEPLPVRIAYEGEDGTAATIAFRQTRLVRAWAAARWKVPPVAGAKAERVALSQVRKAIPPVLEVFLTPASLPVQAVGN